MPQMAQNYYMHRHKSPTAQCKYLSSGPFPLGASMPPKNVALTQPPASNTTNTPRHPPGPLSMSINPLRYHQIRRQLHKLIHLPRLLSPTCFPPSCYSPPPHHRPLLLKYGTNFINSSICPVSSLPRLHLHSPLKQTSSIFVSLHTPPSSPQLLQHDASSSSCPPHSASCLVYVSYWV